MRMRGSRESENGAESVGAAEDQKSIIPKRRQIFIVTFQDVMVSMVSMVCTRVMHSLVS